MPGIIMENGNRNGSQKNLDGGHNRSNGASEGWHISDKSHDKGKGQEPVQGRTPTSPFAPNGLNGNFTVGLSQQEVGEKVKDGQDLPPEIHHITQGYIELKDMLSRLAQMTHTKMLGTITELAQMPPPASVTNGNVSHTSASEDNSPENVNKKVHLLEFLENAHDSWTKALVIAGWSRRAEEVSKIIDLNVHLNNIKQIYLNILGQMGNDKKELTAARMLNPDLRTALEVLTTGKASWMPDLGYIEPPPLTAKEILNSLEKLNTLLSIRLNLSDYNTIPIHFKDYSIQSGRATFKVPGEFEVDLTIAEEDPDAQFWFIDFRFLFKPTAKSFGPQIRFHIESKVNEILPKDGLPGCYRYLHELVLTHKIGEFKKQANDLARGNWIDTLAVEPLNRYLCIQYWVNKYEQPSTTRSWIILGVGSAKRKTAGPKSKATSHLVIRWFRDAKEVENTNVPFDSVNISTESLLRNILAMHIAHILESMHDELQALPLFANRELGLDIFISPTEPDTSYLSVQLTHEQTIRVQIEPVTGRIIFSPASPVITRFEHIMNYKCKNLAEAGHGVILQLHYALIEEAITSHAETVGWTRIMPLIQVRQTYKDELVEAFDKYLPVDFSTVIWFERRHWTKGWYLTVFASPSGEHWLLIRLAEVPDTKDKARKRVDPKITNHIQLPVTVASPAASYGFMSTLQLFAAGIMSSHANLRALHSRRCRIMKMASTSPKAIKIPAICFSLREIVPTTDTMRNAGMKLTFHGIETVSETSNDQSLPDASMPIPRSQTGLEAAPDSRLTNRKPGSTRVLAVTQAQLVIPVAVRLPIHANIDQDIAFNAATGSFAFRLRSTIGEPIIDKLVEFVVRIGRLVDFAMVINSHKPHLTAQSILLGKIIFTYGGVVVDTGDDSMDVDHQQGAYRAAIDFTAEKSMLLILEKGNPHVRIVNFLGVVLNSHHALSGVVGLLTQTLPVNRGLDTIIRNWPLVDGSSSNSIVVNARATDWYTIRYSIYQVASAESKKQPMQKQIIFSVKLRERRGDPWWFVYRGDNTLANVKRERDVIDEALLPVWSSSGSGWQGMRSNAVAQNSGIEELLVKLDGAIKTFALAKEAVTEVCASVPVPSAQPQAGLKQSPAQFSRQQQHQRQLQTPNQSQSQTQGRNQPKREVVEID